MWHDMGKRVGTDMGTDMQMGMGTEMWTDMEIDRGTSAEVRGDVGGLARASGFWGCTTMHAWVCVDVHRHTPATFIKTGHIIKTPLFSTISRR